MASVRFTRYASITAEAHVEQLWSALDTGQPGPATIRLARTSPAASAQYIDPDGFSLVEILDEGGSGSWLGVTEEPVFPEFGDIVISAVQIWDILRRVPINHSAALLSAAPGMVVTRALEASMGSVATIRLGAAHDGDAPSISRIEIDGRDPLSVIVEMMQTANASLHMDETGALFWCGQSAYATRHNTLLVAGGNLLEVQVTHQSRERVQAVVASGGGQRYTASWSDAGMMAFPAKATINVDAAGDVLVVAAHAELEQRNQPAITIEGTVGQELWHLRERDFIKVMVPWDGFTGLCRWCRVLTRWRGDDSDRMRLQLQVVPPALGTIQTAGAPARQKPPQRPGRDRQGGSFAQQNRLAAQALARLERR